MSWIITLVVIAAIIFWVVGAYNRLVSLRNKFKNAFAQIDVQLKRRYDLIPNLVETAKAYMKHERETLENVIRARNSAVSANTAAAADPGSAQAIQGLVVAEGALSGALVEAVCFGRGVSRPEGKSEHDAVDRRVDRDREQDFVRAPGLQRFGDELQHCRSAVSDQRHRRRVHVCAGRAAAVD